MPALSVLLRKHFTQFFYFSKHISYWVPTNVRFRNCFVTFQQIYILY